MIYAILSMVTGVVAVVLVMLLIQEIKTMAVRRSYRVLPLQDVRVDVELAQPRVKAPTEIERLEHETEIAPLGDDPDHCAYCAREDFMRRQQADCPHTEISEMHELGQYQPTQRICVECGLDLLD